MNLPTITGAPCHPNISGQQTPIDENMFQGPQYCNRVAEEKPEKYAILAQGLCWPIDSRDSMTRVKMGDVVLSQSKLDG